MEQIPTVSGKNQLFVMTELNNRVEVCNTEFRRYGSTIKRLKELGLIKRVEKGLSHIKIRDNLAKRIPIELNDLGKKVLAFNSEERDIFTIGKTVFAILDLLNNNTEVKLIQIIKRLREIRNITTSKGEIQRLLRYINYDQSLISDWISHFVVPSSIIYYSITDLGVKSLSKHEKMKSLMNKRRVQNK